MDKISIVKNELYIGHVHRVIQNYILKSKIGYCLPRLTDAFVYILNGSCNYTFTDGVFFTAKKGDLLYLSKNSVYKMDIVSEKYSFIFCDFDFLVDAPCQSAVFSKNDSDQLNIVFNRLLFTYGAKHVAWQSECVALIYALYSKIIKTEDVYNSRASKLIAEKAQAYFLKNLSNPKLSIEETATLLKISEVHLRRVFNSVFGISPAKYIINKRILLAKDLIKLPYMAIEDVAEQCGFATVPYFYKTFKRITGQTPKEYVKSVS